MDNVVYGYLQTAFAIAQLLGGPLFGRYGILFLVFLLSKRVLSSMVGW